jgi:hypothetical protein
MDKAKFLGLVRHVLTLAGGLLLAKGYLEENQLNELIGGVLSLFGTGWSIASKKSSTPTAE